VAADDAGALDLQYMTADGGPGVGDLVGAAAQHRLVVAAAGDADGDAVGDADLVEGGQRPAVAVLGGDGGAAAIDEGGEEEIDGCAHDDLGANRLI
jgi:hypothetical protein